MTNVPHKLSETASRLDPLDKGKCGCCGMDRLYSEREWNRELCARCERLETEDYEAQAVCDLWENR